MSNYIIFWYIILYDIHIIYSDFPSDILSDFISEMHSDILSAIWWFPKIGVPPNHPF